VRLASAGSAVGRQFVPTDVYQAIDKQANAIDKKVVGWRHQIHEHPELPNREKNTAKLVADHLNSIGFDEVKTGVARHGVVGILKGGKKGTKVMGLRADMDALPIKELQDVKFKSTVVDKDYPGGPHPVGHMCGHDAHTAMLMGAAEVLANLREELPGRVKLLFQPAEEGPPITEQGGASLMVKQGVLKDPKPGMIFVLHTGPFPDHHLFYTPNHALASSDYLEIKVKGAGVHGSTPWMGKDPMPVAAEIISALGQLYRQEPATDAMTISIGHVEDSGRFNTIGDDVTLIGTIRIIEDDIIDDVHRRVKRVAENIAKAHGLTATVKFRQHVPALQNEPKWLDRVLPTVKRVMGEDRVKQVPPVLAYDDASDFVNPIGGAYMILGGQDVEFKGEEFAAKKKGRGMWFNHSPHFYWNDKNLKNGVRIHSNVAVDFLTGKI
jgi:amidohydrolase